MTSTSSSRFQAYKQAELDFSCNIMRDRLGQTTRYGGTVTTGFKTGMINRMPSLARINLQKTEKTRRTCRTCRGTRATALNHINGMISLQKCPTCKGSGVTFG